MEDGKTIVQLDAQVELDGVAAFMPQLARLAVKHGVDDNLATLKLILEERRAKSLAETAAKLRSRA